MHAWDWTTVLLYRWPRLMSSVCVSLMFAASRAQTASRRVLGNEDSGGGGGGGLNVATWKYVNPSHSVTALFTAAAVCKKNKSPPHVFGERASACLESLPQLPLTHVNTNPLSLHKIAFYDKQWTWHMREERRAGPICLRLETLSQYCFLKTGHS